MKLGLLVKHAPSKVGTMERWLLAFTEEAVRRGHTVDIFGFVPVHPFVEGHLEALGAGFSTIGELTSSKAVAVSRLATYDVLHLDLFGAHELPALVSWAAWPARVVLTDYGDGTGGPASRTDRLVGHALDRMISPRLHLLIGVSDFLRDAGMRRFGLARNRVRTIHHGVDTTRFRPAKRHAAPTLAAMPSHLTTENGLEVLLRAMALMEHREPRLTLRADGRERDVAEALARELGIDHRVGFVDLHGDVEAFLDDADIFVEPSLRDAGCALTVAEGMAAGCAVVASRVGGMPEYVEHGRSGLLVEPSNPRALADTLDDLVDSPDLRRHLGRAARKRAEDRFALDSCARRHLDAVEHVAREASRKREPERPLRVAPDMGELA